MVTLASSLIRSERVTHATTGADGPEPARAVSRAHRCTTARRLVAAKALVAAHSSLEQHDREPVPASAGDGLGVGRAPEMHAVRNDRGSAGGWAAFVTSPS